MNSLKSYQSFMPKHIKENAIKISQQQHAEEIFFNYLMELGARFDIPLNHLQSMATYLGKPLEVSFAETLSSKLKKNSITDIEKYIQNVGKEFATLDLPSEKKRLDKENSEWISIHVPELSLEEHLKELEKEKWRPTDEVPPAYPHPKVGSAKKSKKTLFSNRIFRILIILILFFTVFFIMKTKGITFSKLVGSTLILQKFSNVTSFDFTNATAPSPIIIDESNIELHSKETIE